MGQTLSTSTGATGRCVAADGDGDPKHGRVPDEHCCRISSQKNPPLELRSKRPPSKAVSGTCFVYFHTETAVSLRDYIRIRCTSAGVCSGTGTGTGTDTDTLHAAAFQMSALKFDNEVVHLGETYYQFRTACTQPPSEGEGSLLVRTRKRRCDGTATDPRQSASLMSEPRRWTFVWERCVRHGTTAGDQFPPPPPPLSLLSPLSRRLAKNSPP
jgi:hypothetical protein